MLVPGDGEEDAGTVSVRDRQEREQKDIALDAFVDHLDSEVAGKRTEPDFLVE